MPGAVGTRPSIGAIAAALGPPVGGLSVQLSWHWIFLVNLPLGLAALIAPVGCCHAPARRARGGPTSPVPSRSSLPSVRRRGLWVRAAGLGLTTVVVRSARHPVPAVDLAVLRSPPIALASLATLVFTVGFTAMLLVSVLFLTGTWGWSAQQAGIALVPGPLVVVLVARFAGGWAARWGAGPVAAAGGLSFALGPGPLTGRSGGGFRPAGDHVPEWWARR